MLPYIVLNFIILFWGLLSNDKRLKKLSKVCVVVTMVCFAGFRGEFTSDHADYSKFFTLISKMSWKEVLRKDYSNKMAIELGFAILTKCLSYISSSTVVFTLSISMITVGIYLCVIVKSENWWLGVLLFTCIGDYYQTFNLYRQTLAAAIILLSYKYIVSRKLIPFIVTVVISSFFHKTALLFLPFYWILNWAITYKNTILQLIILFILYVFLNPIIDHFILKLFPNYSGYTWGMWAGTINAVIPYIGIYAFIIFWLYKIGNVSITNNLDFRVLYNALVWTIIFGLVGTKIYMVNRLCLFFKTAVLILIAEITSTECWNKYCFENKLMISKTRDLVVEDRRLFVFMIVVLCFLFVYVTLYHTGYNPYYLIFSNYESL